MIDATDDRGDVDCFPVEWCRPGRLHATCDDGSGDAVAEILAETGD